MKIGILHPGQMGSAVGRTLSTNVIWASSERSPATAERAGQAGFTDVGTTEEIAATADVVISLCPPAAARAVASRVAAAGFSGIFVEANAVAPRTTIEISDRFDRFVDAAIVGPPPSQNGTTRLFLSGNEAEDVAELFTGSILDAVVLGRAAGSASALKMAYGAWTKGSASLLLAVAAFAVKEGVWEALIDEWTRSQPGLADRAAQTAAAVGPKAWRFEGELREVATAFADAGLPNAFGLASAEVYARLAGLKDSESVDLDTVGHLMIGRTDPGS